MRKLLIACSFLFLIPCVLFFPNTHFPREDIIAIAHSPSGILAVRIEKGYLDEENHGTTWMTLDEWREEMKELEKALKKKKSS